MRGSTPHRLGVAVMVAICGIDATVSILLEWTDWA